MSKTKNSIEPSHAGNSLFNDEIIALPSEVLVLDQSKNKFSNAGNIVHEIPLDSQAKQSSDKSAAKSKNSDSGKSLTLNEAKNAMRKELDNFLNVERERLKQEVKEKLDKASKKADEDLKKMDLIGPIAYRVGALNASISEIERVLKKLGDRINGTNRVKKKQQQPNDYSTKDTDHE
jgi:hypothetical protein